MKAKIRAGGMTLSYEEFGEGKDLVLVHPAPLDSGAWLFQTPRLAEEYHVVAYDQRCFGESDKPTAPFDVSEYGTDLVSVASALGLRRPHVVGLSLGGIAAQLALLSSPESFDRVVLASTLSNTTKSPTIQERVRRFRGDGIRGYYREAVESLFSPRFLSSKVGEYFVEEYVERSSRLSAESVARCYEALARLNITEKLGSISAPTLVLGGTEDYAYRDTKEIAGAIPGAAYKEFGVRAPNPDRRPGWLQPGRDGIPRRLKAREKGLSRHRPSASTDAEREKVRRRDPRRPHPQVGGDRRPRA